MPPSDFATADIDKVLNELTTDEAILLTAGGQGFWYTQPVDRLGIPAIKVAFYSLYFYLSFITCTL
jgi:beta-glucosidase